MGDKIWNIYFYSAFWFQLISHYFVYWETNLTFRINGKDKVKDVDPDTGLPLNRDDSSEDADGVQVLPLERLPEVK